MNVKAIAACVLWSLANIAVGFALYHGWNAGEPRQNIATLDIAEIYRLKESQFTALLLKPGTNEADRAQAIELARAFGAELSALTRTLPRECRCLVLTKAAVVGEAENIPDLTPEIKRRFGL